MVDQAYTAEQALTYEEDTEHTLPREEAEAWIAIIHAMGLPTGARIVDYGAGTGTLMAALKGAGYPVLGLEPSNHMVAEGLRLHSELGVNDFIVGTDMSPGPQGGGGFDLIVSRQVLCHLKRPDLVFKQLHQWLRPNGWVLLVDGFWTGFSADQKQVFPLAGIKDATLAAEALAAAGFDIARAEAFHELNQARAAVCPGGVSRYVIVGRKSLSALG